MLYLEATLNVLFCTISFRVWFKYICYPSCLLRRDVKMQFNRQSVLQVRHHSYIEICWKENVCVFLDKGTKYDSHSFMYHRTPTRFSIMYYGNMVEIKYGTIALQDHHSVQYNAERSIPTLQLVDVCLCRPGHIRLVIYCNVSRNENGR